MNPVWQIAHDQLSIEQLEEIITSKRKKEGHIKKLSDREQMKERYRQRFRK